MSSVTILNGSLKEDLKLKFSVSDCLNKFFCIPNFQIWGWNIAFYMIFFYSKSFTNYKLHIKNLQGTQLYKNQK